MPMTLNPGRVVVEVNRRVELIISNNSSRGCLLFKPVLVDVFNRFLRIREKMRISVLQTLGALSTVAESKTNNKESLKKLEGKS